MNKIIGDILFKWITWPYLKWVGTQYYKASRGNLDLALMLVNLKISDKEDKQAYRLLVFCDGQVFQRVTYSLAGVCFSLAIIMVFDKYGYYDEFKTMKIKYYKIEDRYDAKTGERIFNTI